MRKLLRVACEPHRPDMNLSLRQRKRARSRGDKGWIQRYVTHIELRVSLTLRAAEPHQRARIWNGGAGRPCSSLRVHSGAALHA